MNNIDIQTLDSKTLAQRLCLSRRQIYRLMKEKKIPAPVRVGGVWRWPESEIADWLAAGAHKKSKLTTREPKDGCDDILASLGPYATIERRA